MLQLRTARLEWHETSEVIRKKFEEVQDGDIKRVGLCLIDEVERLRGILRHLEKRG